MAYARWLHNANVKSLYVHYMPYARSMPFQTGRNGPASIKLQLKNKSAQMNDAERDELASHTQDRKSLQFAYRIRPNLCLFHLNLDGTASHLDIAGTECKSLTKPLCSAKP